ncbi:PaaI family thioesterase [Natrinema sp. 1APR25-10V2]|uniref:PaaI family thioesterase n=1 Tax=Natrinema sp. 1APR25-10V2 TaxID=2951081 RepID=UPI0028766998|nr:PaaI family thioesterase [Natrinema sp. 1APR25-10V2]MDS0475768.1 PaaI family thioesterase [Natrinema sp. 1APR25-10V2]
MTAERPSVFSDLIDLEFVDVDPGYSRGVIETADELLNPNGVLHGGVLYTMADTGMGAALAAMLEEDEQCATIEIKINYLEPVRTGRVTCDTNVLRKGGSVAYLESDISHDGETVARATGTFSVFSP